MVLGQIRPHGDSLAGSRALLAEPWCAALSQTVRAQLTLSKLIPANFVSVQCTYFEKSTSRNWLVPIHQDLSIPVAHRVEDSTLSGWSVKEGSLFVQPPCSVLAELVAVRVHLDPCSANDGPLRVIPGSHTFGPTSPESAVAARRAGTEVACTCEQGAALVMRPLLLHSSSKATGTSKRRVLHFLFGPPQLPFGLTWQIAV
nr:phytanoyl-CoA dioxygenase family protein [Rhizobacter sp. AJA081-3]